MKLALRIYGIIFVSSCVFLSSNALDIGSAKNIQMFIENRGSANTGDETITKDEKYTSEVCYGYLNRIIDGQPFEDLEGKILETEAKKILFESARLEKSFEALEVRQKRYKNKHILDTKCGWMKK
jgi:hypothetical protein